MIRPGVWLLKFRRLKLRVFEVAGQLAFISDIHANRPALEAVLEDIDRRKVAGIYNLGDSLFGPLDPDGTFELLVSRNITHICGNGDRDLLAPDDGSESTLNRQRRVLSSAQRSWIASLPGRIDEDDVTAFHGAPDSDEVYLLESLTAEGVSRKSVEEVVGLLAGIEAEVVVCGHSHLPSVLRLPDRRLVINAGSVGLPAYHDDWPVAHKMESGTPHAKYALVEKTKGRWQVEIVMVPYNWRKAADLALANGRPDWAEYLLTGLALGV